MGPRIMMGMDATTPRTMMMTMMGHRMRTTAAQEGEWGRVASASMSMMMGAMMHWRIWMMMGMESRTLTISVPALRLGSPPSLSGPMDAPLLNEMPTRTESLMWMTSVWGRHVMSGWTNPDVRSSPRRRSQKPLDREGLWVLASSSWFSCW